MAGDLTLFRAEMYENRTARLQSTELDLGVGATPYRFEPSVAVHISTLLPCHRIESWEPLRFLVAMVSRIRMTTAYQHLGATR